MGTHHVENCTSGDHLCIPRYLGMSERAPNDAKLLEKSPDQSFQPFGNRLTGFLRIVRTPTSISLSLSHLAFFRSEQQTEDRCGWRANPMIEGTPIDHPSVGKTYAKGGSDG